MGLKEEVVREWCGDFVEGKKAGMGRKGAVTFRKGCNRKQGTRLSFPNLWMWPCEVQKLYKKLKLPRFEP
jgi:hypothetical protein